MKKLTILIPLLALGALSSAQAANDYLSFADMGGIRNFKADGDKGIYVEGRNREWYYAKFFGPCYDLRFHDQVGFVIDATGDLDRFSSILVGGQQCYFKSFERTDKPD